MKDLIEAQRSSLHRSFTGKLPSVYVGDMVMKSQSVAQHVADLEEVFVELHKYDMHLNPEKYTFVVGEGKFLGFMITH